jgi:hypothetical protein
LEILHESGRQLGDLRKQVQNLVTFFGDILNKIEALTQVKVQKGLL